MINWKGKTGWLRIWIVFSIIYFFSMSWYALGERADYRERIYNLYYNSCNLASDSNTLKNPTTKPIVSNCIEYATQETNIEIKNRPTIAYIAIFAIVPLILIWIMGYIILKIFNWIKKGFEVENK